MGFKSHPPRLVVIRRKFVLKAGCFCGVLLSAFAVHGAEPLVFDDPQPQKYHIQARASEIDKRAIPHPEVDFVFEKNGKPADVEHACVDTRVKPRGKLVIWLMAYNPQLFDRFTRYGLHAIQPHYANGWFKILNREPPPDDKYLGRIRLEAATGEDVSEAIDIPRPDGMQERAVQFVKYLAKVNPQGKWDFFLNADQSDLNWEDVIVSGSSHGSTTSARFAIHKKVGRVVMLSGPRDQHETWQALPPATPHNRFFGFTHVLDEGWPGNHYPRSWKLLGLDAYGPIVNVDQTPARYKNSRRLVTDADVNGNSQRAHGASQPGRNAVKDADGNYLHESVWEYLYTHPVDEVGEPESDDSQVPSAP